MQSEPILDLAHLAPRGTVDTEGERKPAIFRGRPFKEVDEIIVEVFNGPPSQQPQGICDMGCGNGTFLEHLYSIVKQHTARGSVLDQNPLVLVGADFNKVARRATKQTLRRAGIPKFHVIHGDINRPAQLASDLKSWAWMSTTCCIRFSTTTGRIVRRQIMCGECA